MSSCSHIGAKNPEIAVKTQVSENVTWKNLGNSLVLLNLVDSTYYVLNETASLAFQGIRDGRSNQQLAESFVQEYDCPADQAAADVETVLEYLSKEGLIKATE
jgi:hypothetical protein